MNAPLTTWRCDVCGLNIEDARHGYVIWKNNDERKAHGFKIIHRRTCDRKDHFASRPLNDFLGGDGLTGLLAFLSRGPIFAKLGREPSYDVADLDEFVDLIRRVQTPFYEEARRMFANPELLYDYCDANEIAPYLSAELQKIANRYRSS